MASAVQVREEDEKDELRVLVVYRYVGYDLIKTVDMFAYCRCTRSREHGAVRWLRFDLQQGRHWTGRTQFGVGHPSERRGPDATAGACVAQRSNGMGHLGRHNRWYLHRDRGVLCIMMGDGITTSRLGDRPTLRRLGDGSVFHRPFLAHFNDQLGIHFIDSRM